jgi:hypothetical protein
LTVAGERPNRSAICAIDRPSPSRKWRAKATARWRSIARSYLVADELEAIPSRYGRIRLVTAVASAVVAARRV